MSPLSLYTYFQGTWQLRRTITDHLTNKTGYMEGEAIFLPLDPKTLHYQETGIVVLENYEGIFQQEHLYNNLINHQGQVCFKDQRLFYDLDLKTGNQQILHTCGNDTYLGHLELLNENEWKIEWDIKGQKKHMSILSVYKK